jgi:hypothetical protein
MRPLFLWCAARVKALEWAVSEFVEKRLKGAKITVKIVGVGKRQSTRKPWGGRIS